MYVVFFFFFQAEDGIRDVAVTGVQTCALPISREMLLGKFLSTPGRTALPDARQGAARPLIPPPHAPTISREMWLCDPQSRTARSGRKTANRLRRYTRIHAM